MAAIARYRPEWYESLMPNWLTPLSIPPVVMHAWSNVAWHAPRTEHRLDGLWQLHAYGHRGSVQAETPLGSLHADLAPGCVTLLPPGALSRYDVPGRSRFSCLHVRLDGLPTTEAAALVADDPLTATLIAVAAESATAGRDAAAAVAPAWAALWRLAAAATGRTGAVAKACAWIESNLEDPPSVQDVARRLGISTAHLRRRFRAEIGLGVKPWIQRRRAERARHLLMHSTRSIRDIAAELGIDDLQRFNKLMRKQFGQPPRHLRQE